MQERQYDKGMISVTNYIKNNTEIFIEVGYKYIQLFKSIDYLYKNTPDNFNFIPIEYFSGSWDKLNEVLNYCITNRYVIKNDPNFQKYVADNICNMNSHQQFDVIVYEQGIQNANNLCVFYYACKNILTKDTIKNYVNDKNETLAHQVYIKQNILNPNYISKILPYIDNFEEVAPNIAKDFQNLFNDANFEFTDSIIKLIFIKNLEIRNFKILYLILKSKKLNINDDDIFKILFDLLLMRVTPLKYKANTSINPIYKINYNDENMIKELFNEKMLLSTDNNSNTEMNKHIINKINLHVGKQENLNLIEYENGLNRSNLVRPLLVLINYYNAYKIFIFYGLDLTKKVNGMTLYELYMDGCLPIKLLNPDMHNYFRDLFTKKD